MRCSKVLRKLRAGEPVFCLKSSYALPEIVELMGVLGVDVVWICNEHNELDAAQSRSVMRAGRAADVDILYRRAFSTYDRLIQLLEMGVAGVMIPHCRSAAMAREIVAAAKFPPLGKRGFDGINADSDFGTRPLTEYLAHANRETFVMVQIEDVEAVDEIEAIAAVPGIDIIFIGPADLSQSLGAPGECKHPEIRRIIRRTVRACRNNGIFCGTAGLDAEYMKALLDDGVSFLSVKSDYGILKDGIKTALAETARLLSERQLPEVFRKLNMMPLEK